MPTIAGLGSRSVLAAVLLVMPVFAGEARHPARTDAVVAILQSELDRSMAGLSKADPAPYFLSYSVTDKKTLVVMASEGAILTSMDGHRRSLDVGMRLGSPALDNTHEESRASALSTAVLPLVDDPDAMRRVLWLTTDGEYKKAAQAYLKVKTGSAVHAKEEDDSPDFSKQAAHTYLAPPLPPLQIDRAALESRLRAVSAEFRKQRDVYNSLVVLIVQDTTHYLVSSEGTQVVTRERLWREMLQGDTRTDDGMDLLSVQTFQSSSLDKLPGEAEMVAAAQKIIQDLKQLRAAAPAEPFDGPALLSGRAAAVFFHEVLGHRLEGQRQRGEKEGQTFTKKINQSVLPGFLDVVDDPLQRQLGGTELSGAYQYDDEGVPAQRVEVIHDGVLKSFLMSRMPVKNFSESNGHGRAEEGHMPVGRQGNLIVTSSLQVPDAELRTRLVEEAKKQGKPYGLYFEDIEGGFTFTQRSLPQAFQVLPVKVWRVYADGRPDELVRGVDIVGTPLAALTRIAVTGSTMSVFNGVCGAESGSVPVSAAAPAMLLSELEVQKRPKSKNRPPILAPPAFDEGKEPATKTAGDK